MIPEKYKQMIAEAGTSEELTVVRQKALNDNSVGIDVFLKIQKATVLRIAELIPTPQ